MITYMKVIIYITYMKVTPKTVHSTRGEASTMLHLSSKHGEALQGRRALPEVLGTQEAAQDRREQEVSRNLLNAEESKCKQQRAEAL